MTLLLLDSSLPWPYLPRLIRTVLTFSMNRFLCCNVCGCVVGHWIIYTQVVVCGQLEWCSILAAYLSGYNILSLQWSPVVSFAAPFLIFATSAGPVLVLEGRRVLRSAARGELLVSRARLAIMQRRAFSVVGPSACSLWTVGMIRRDRSPLGCGPFWLPTPPNFTSLSSPSSLSVTGLGALLSSSSLLKRRYISLQIEWMRCGDFPRAF